MVSTLRDVRVESDERGALLVWWQAEDPIDIGIGATPNTSEHTSVATAVDSGLFASSGRFHGGPMCHLPAGPATGCRRGTSCPIRGDHQLARPRGLPHRRRRGDVVGSGVSIPTRPRPEMTGRDGEKLLRDTYVGALTHSATEIGAVMRGLADPVLTPAVFHCHAGKDRTGLIAVVLLLALGVDRYIVLDDYEATRLYRFPEHQQHSLANMLQAGISPDAAALACWAPPRWAMAEAVDLLLGFARRGRRVSHRPSRPATSCCLRLHLVSPADAT